MRYLLIVSVIWAFSFGLIKGQLTGLDSNFVTLARMALSLAVFLPFLRLKKISSATASVLMLTGAVQYGLMYALYIYSFKMLHAYEVALFTILTPLYVTIINDLAEKHFHPVYFLSAVLAVSGTAIIKYGDVRSGDLVAGFLIVQASNIAFAGGQIAYKKIMSLHNDLRDLDVFALLYLGGCILSGILSGVTTDYRALHVTPRQVLTLTYLGILASGICFFLWNRGVRLTNTGTLAVINNLKIPLAVAVSMIFFGEKGSLLRLLAGGCIIISSLFISEKYAGLEKKL